MEEKIDLFEFYMQQAEHASELANQVHNMYCGIPATEVASIATLYKATQVLLECDIYYKDKAFRIRKLQMKGDTGV